MLKRSVRRRTVAHLLCSVARLRRGARRSYSDCHVGPVGELTPMGGNESALASIAQPWVFERLFSIDVHRPVEGLVLPRVWSGSPLSGSALELRRDATFSDGTPVTERGRRSVVAGGGLKVTPSEAD